MIDAAAIISVDETRVGIADTDGPALHRNLDRLVASINESAGLSGAGEESVRNALIARTTDRLEGLKWLRDHPEIAGERIEAPIFLTGLPRSGTTFFQYLFDRDPRFRLIRTWEAITPSPPPGTDPASVERRKAEEEERRRATRPPVKGFEAMHLVDRDGPEECHAFLEQAYGAAGFLNLLDVPDYIDFLSDGLDMAAAYRIHKRQLQLLQWRMPQPRWALKYPAHVMAMDAIIDVHPDARFVMTHRDPVQTLASLCKLTVMLRGTRTAAPVDPRRVGRQMLAFIRSHLDGIMAFADGPNAERVVHVDYYRLLDDPAIAMERVHRGLGIDSPPSVRAAAADWQQNNPKGARGANPYRLGDFGLEEAEALEAFGNYMARFAIPREAEGLGASEGETLC